jgi:hypothetical protein
VCWPRTSAIAGPARGRAGGRAADAPRVREVTVDHLLELAGPPAARFYTCSPYVGCLIGCRFCYAQERLAAGRAAAGLPMAPWGSWVDVRVNAAAVLADELARLPRYPIKFCPIVSDPYHAIEARLGLTRACLAAIAAAAAPPPVLLLTRAALVTRDLDLLAALPWAGVGVSLPTIDDDVRAHFEPRAAPIAARLATLARSARRRRADRGGAADAAGAGRRAGRRAGGARRLGQPRRAARRGQRRAAVRRSALRRGARRRLAARAAGGAHRRAG